MKITVVMAAAGMLSLASCSTENDPGPADDWVTASSLGPSEVPYTPKPIIALRETGAGLWIWLPETKSSKTMDLECFQVER